MWGGPGNGKEGGEKVGGGWAIKVSEKLGRRGVGRGKGGKRD